MDLIGIILALHHVREMLDRLAVGNVSPPLVTSHWSQGLRTAPSHVTQ